MAAWTTRRGAFPCMLSGGLCDGLIVLKQQPPIGVDQQGVALLMISHSRPDRVVEPIVRRDPVELCIWNVRHGQPVSFRALYANGEC